MTEKKRVLGRGLDALLGMNAGNIVDTENENGFKNLSVNLMQRGQYQPRNDFNSEGLQELAISIKTQGIIQPIIVRQIQDGRFEIIAGERRWLAAKIAGLLKVPVIVKEIDDSQAMAIALIENIQREDLHCLEQAQALQKLASKFTMTHQQLADLIGKSRATVTNLLRLLDLCESVKTLLRQGKLEMGHARTLISLTAEQQLAIAEKIIEANLTVRETEKLVQLSYVDNFLISEPLIKSKVQKNVFCNPLKATLTIKNAKNGQQGQIIIPYKNKEQFEKIVHYLQVADVLLP